MTVVKSARLVVLAWKLWRMVRLVLLLPVLGAGSVVSGVLWLFAPGVALDLLWRWSTTPGTRLHQVRERLLVGMARRARALGV